ncbi:MAG: Nramp family divalent metal transporter [Fuerstiella sp.]|nr:Nramp family divalent metal transporter [Fuerstiella sp.]
MSKPERESAGLDDPYTRSSDFLLPPCGVWATLRQLGPGIILVGGIVGSGELIMTTRLGAIAGFGLLWFVLLSCFIKVVVQAELARHTISSGETFLTVFNKLPGPAVRRPVWLTLSWMSVVLVASTIALSVYVQLESVWKTWWIAAAFAGVVVVAAVLGGWIISRNFGHAHAGLSSGEVRSRRPRVNWFTWLWLASMLLIFVNSAAILGGAGQAVEMALPDWFGENGSAVWAIILAVVAASLLLSGTYSVLEKTLIVMVVTFTLLTVVCTVLLQWTGYAVTWADVRHGLSMSIPHPMSTTLGLTALGMFAGTGVAFGEMWIYTYWCVEKGYARNVGDTLAGPQWAHRARGWIGVMYADVLVTMMIYTVTTVCFYVLGCAILHTGNIDPEGPQTISVLSTAYSGSLGNWAATLFVVGAFFVLFTTVLAGVAGTSRLMADALAVIGIIDSSDYHARLRFIRVFVVVSLAMSCIAYWLFQDPPAMLAVTSALIGALMYPILGLGVLYLRHCRVDRRIVPGRLATVWLWICGISLALISPGGVLLALAIENGWILIGK